CCTPGQRACHARVVAKSFENQSVAGGTSSATRRRCVRFRTAESHQRTSPDRAYFQWRPASGLGRWARLYLGSGDSGAGRGQCAGSAGCAFEDKGGLQIARAMRENPGLTTVVTLSLPRDAVVETNI